MPRSPSTRPAVSYSTTRPPSGSLAKITSEPTASCMPCRVPEGGTGHCLRKAKSGPNATMRLWPTSAAKISPSAATATLVGWSSFASPASRPISAKLAPSAVARTIRLNPVSATKKTPPPSIASPLGK